jgi:very-short-patch-repair endonuclease
VRDFLLALARAEIGPAGNGRGYDEQFQHLLSIADPASELEREFLLYLHERRLRLPDAVQTRPLPDVFVQPDFYYERDGLPGACVFIDGSVHESERQEGRDRELRDALEDRGFRVIVVRGSDFRDPVERNPDIFHKI